MLLIEGNIITLTRGDSAYIHVELITEDCSAYQMQEGDRLRLTVRERADDSHIILMETESSTDTILLAPAVTGAVAPGKYSCDIQLETAAGDVYTVLGAESVRTNLKNFVVLPEVTV